MKLTYAIAAALLASSPTAFAIPIGTVGGADTLVKWASLDDSSDAAEKQMIAEYLNVDADTLSYTHLGDDSGGESGAWVGVDGNADLYAFHFGGAAPAYFLIKVGSGIELDNVDGTFSHFLYENVTNLSYGVIDFSPLSKWKNDKDVINIGVVSHVSTVGGGTVTTVPEPATLSMLGAGLMAVPWLARRKKRRA